MSKTTSEVLLLRSENLIDESITEYEYHDVLPYANSTFNNDDEVRFPLHQRDIYTLPAESQLFIEGTIKKAVDGTLDPPKEVKLSKNGVNFLFSDIRYELEGKCISQLSHVGVTSLMKGLISFNHGQSVKLQNAGWHETLAKTYFNYCIPLKILLGFMEDYTKILLNSKQELVIILARTYKNLYMVDEEKNDVAIKITGLKWRMPILKIADAQKLELSKLIQKNIPIQIAFRNWSIYEYSHLPNDSRILYWPIRISPNLEKPRFVIVGFQTNRKDNIFKDASVFDHCKIRNVKLYLGTACYPYTSLNVDFEKNKTSVLYENFACFRKSYYGDEKEECIISPDIFNEKCPLWVIDCSRQCESIKNGTVSIKLEIEGASNFPANTTAYCLILNDTVIEYTPFNGYVKILG